MEVLNVVCSGDVGNQRRSGRCVEQLSDHLLHLLRPILEVLLRVLGEGDVVTSGRNQRGVGRCCALIGCKRSLTVYASVKQEVFHCRMT